MTEVKQLHEVGGLMSCLFTHDVQKSTARFEWTGPKLTRETWHQVLAFFHWTYQEYHSESQVRFFVNHRLGLWAAHAFPQEARTGMSTTELHPPSEVAQRSRFSDAEGWIYWGTAHHHCSGGAFQSGTDLNNERNQDGLHITVGKIDQEVHDLHARLYVASFELPLNLSLFWDVGQPDQQLPPALRRLLPPHWKHELAVQQMCEAPPKDTIFPQEWKDNVIEVKKEPVKVSAGLGLTNSSSHWENQNPTYGRNTRKIWNLGRDVMLAAVEWKEAIAEENELEEEKDKIGALDMLEHIESEGSLFLKLIEILQRNDVSFDSLLEHFAEEQSDLEIQQELKEQREQLEQQTGVPDYEGHQQLPE